MSKKEDEIAQEIGYLIFAFNSLEDCIEMVLFEILHPRTNELGKIITERYSFSRKLSLLKKMYEHYLEASDEEKGKKELKDLIGNIKSINSKRNKVIHAAWEEFFYDELKEKVRARWKISKGRVTELSINEDPSSIKKTRNEIENLDELLFEFHEKYFLN